MTTSRLASWIAPDLKAVLDRLTDVQILALTLFGEACSEPIEGIVGVGCVIRNRVTTGLEWWGEGYREVCLAPYQFSMWHRFLDKDGVDRNYDAVMSMAEGLANGGQTGPVPAECLWAATGVFNTTIRDRVKAPHTTTR